MNPPDSGMAPAFARAPLPKRLCNLDRLVHGLKARGLDGIVATTALNVFYLSGLNGIAHKSDEPRTYAVVISRHKPEQPIAVIADYYLASLVANPTWIEDVRPHRGVMLGLDLDPQASDVNRFLPEDAAGVAWVEQARERSNTESMGAVLRGALKDLGLESGKVAFDDMGVGFRLGLEGMTVADGYDPLIYARAIKTPAEMPLIERATQLNQAAIERTVASWDKGCSWRQMNRAYQMAAADLGGFTRDPGAMVWGHPRGTEHTLFLQTGLEDFGVEEGMHVMFDCHGTLDLYCWDGGKTWVVGGGPSGPGKKAEQATAAVAEEMLAAMRPGARISELQARGRAVYRKAGVSDPDAALIFFHGLGLSHMDVELATAEGKPNGDWLLEDGMVVPLHLLYPGAPEERCWLEEVVAITPDGGRPLFTWGFDMLTG